MGSDRLDLVTVFETWHPVQAWLVRNLLVEEGVNAVVADDFVVGTYWLFANAVGGVKVLVPRRLAEQAISVLAQQHAEHLPPSPLDSPEAPRCHHCNSADVCPERYSRRGIFIAWLILGFPVPFASQAVRCLSCGSRDYPHGPRLSQGQFSLKQLMVVVTVAACICGILRLTNPALGGANSRPGVEWRR